jgi:hypothetical protein
MNGMARAQCYVHAGIECWSEREGCGRRLNGQRDNTRRGRELHVCKFIEADEWPIALSPGRPHN